MKLPVVSRLAYERAINASFDANQRALVAEARLDAALDALRSERARVDALIRPVATLTSSSGTLPLAERRPSVIATVIREESAGDQRLAAYLRKRANELRAEGKAPEEIAEQLRTWQTTETEGRE